MLMLTRRIVSRYPLIDGAGRRMVMSRVLESGGPVSRVIVLLESDERSRLPVSGVLESRCIGIAQNNGELAMHRREHEARGNDCA
jgi:hypothetical protein